MSNPKSSDLGPVFLSFASLQILGCLLGIPISARIFRSEKWDKHLKAWDSLSRPYFFYHQTLANRCFFLGSSADIPHSVTFLNKQILWFNLFLGSFLKSKIAWKLRLFPIFAFCLLPAFLGFKSGSEQRKCKYIDLYYLCLVWKETGIVVLETCWGYPVGCGYPKWPWIGNSCEWFKIYLLRMRVPPWFWVSSLDLLLTGHGWKKRLEESQKTWNHHLPCERKFQFEALCRWRFSHHLASEINNKHFLCQIGGFRPKKGT